ncbi:hypothetical protein Hanom_Chr02g00142141 [Helianthus anomalus]
MGDDPKIYVYVVCIYVSVRRFCPLVDRLERPDGAREDAAAGDGGGRNGRRIGAAPGRRGDGLHTVEPY